MGRRAWAGYAACAWGLLFAVVSFYWAAGGTAGADTVGGSIERLARAHDPAIVAALVLTGLLKVVGALLALALVRPWGLRLRPRLRRATRALAWTAAVLLTLYGGVLVAVEALVATRVIRPSGAVDWTALLWHLYLWDMSFLLWGLLFGVAAWHYARRAPAPAR
ncbi:MAG: DUF3995 domain-containing protein [Actinomycetota bacterium]